VPPRRFPSRLTGLGLREAFTNVVDNAIKYSPMRAPTVTEHHDDSTQRRGDTYEMLNNDLGGTARLSVASTATAQDIPADYQQVLTMLGKHGDYKANVLKVNIPRNDISVTVATVKTPTSRCWRARSPGAEGAPQERSGRRGHPSTHDRHTANDLFPALLGHWTCGEARDRVQSCRERAG